jgi:O-antigen/teichoic acid export membrane protein
MILSPITHFFKNYIKQTDSLISITGVLSNKFTQVLLQIMIVRILLPADYSNFFFYYSSITGLSVFIGEGLGVSISRFLSTAKEKSELIVFNSIATGLITSLLPGFFLANQIWLHPEVKLNPLTIVSVVFLAMMLSLSSILQYICVSVGLKRFLGMSQIIFALIILISAGTTAYLLNWQLVLTTLCCVVLTSNSVLIFYLLRNKVGQFPSVNWLTVFDLVKKSLPICGAMALGAPVHVYCLSVLKKVSFNFNPAEVGVFGISFVSYTLVSFLPGALGQFLVPWLLNRNEKSSIESAFLTVSKLYASAGAALLFVILIALKAGLTNLTPLLIGRETVILLLSITGLLAGFVALTSFYLNAVFKSRLVFLSSILHSVLYVVLTTFLVSYLNWGAIGLATAILIATSSQLIFLVCNLNINSFYKRNLSTPEGL